MTVQLLKHPDYLVVPNCQGLGLRLLNSEDVDDLYKAIDNDRQHLMSFQRWAIESSLETTIEHNNESINKMRQGKYLGYRIVTEDGKIIGSIGLRDYNQEAQSAHMGYWISEEYEGKGYASRAINRLMRYAFDDWKLQLIYLEISPDNERSNRLAERLGAAPTDKYTQGSIPNHPFKHRLWEIRK